MKRTSHLGDPESKNITVAQGMGKGEHHTNACENNKVNVYGENLRDYLKIPMIESL